METINSSFLFILLFCILWVPVIIYAEKIECGLCPENRRSMDKDGNLDMKGCAEEDVAKERTQCDVCSVAIGAQEVTEVVKLKDKNKRADFVMPQGWVHSRGCAPNEAKPDTCERKKDKFYCYCSTPLCNLGHPECTSLTEADPNVKDPKGCMKVVQLK